MAPILVREIVYWLDFCVEIVKEVQTLGRRERIVDRLLSAIAFDRRRKIRLELRQILHIQAARPRRRGVFAPCRENAWVCAPLDAEMG